jgi:hypothetical protein
MAVSDASDRDPGDEVDVRVTVGVEDPAPLAARHGQARVQRKGLEPRRHVTLLEGHDLLRVRADLDAVLHRFGHRDARIRTVSRVNLAARSAAMCRAGLGPKEREARPGVQVDHGDRTALGDDGVAAVDLQAERGRPPGRRRSQRVWVEGEAREVLVAVVEPLKPRGALVLGMIPRRRRT